jgi:hypothetical protein
MSEAGSGGTATEPGAEVGALITSLADSKELAKWLADTDVAGLVVDWLVEETSLPRAVVRPSVILVARLIAGSARSGAGWLGKRAAKSSIWLLRQMPYGPECAEALGRLRGRFDAEISAKQEFREILAGKRPAREASSGDRLPFDLQADLKLVQDVEGLSAGIVEILARLDPQPPLRLDLLEPTHATRMQYGAQRTPLVGRDAELERLGAFLDDERSFLWWLVVAAGGAGKSRLALELCQRRGVAWRAGFLVTEASFAWSTWRPDCPTLIVVDYVTPDKAGRLQDIIKQLRAPAEPFDYPVRLLLLERDGEGSPWYEELVPPGTTHGRAITQLRFDAPLRLAPLDDAAVEAVQKAMTPGAMPADSIERLDAVDPERRPLFAMLTTETTGVTDREQIVRDYLKREDEQYWRPHGVTDADRHLLALATMVGGTGLPVKDAVAIDSGGLLPDADSYDPKRLRRMTGRDARDFVPPLQPDLIGDLFVLDTLERRHGADDRPARFHAWAWSRSLAGMFGLLSRAGWDYPHHPSLKPLLAPPPGGGAEQRSLWAARAFALIHNYCGAGSVPMARCLWHHLVDLSAAHASEYRLLTLQAAGGLRLIAGYLTAGDLPAAIAFHDELIRHHRETGPTGSTGRPHLISATELLIRRVAKGSAEGTALLNDPSFEDAIDRVIEDAFLPTVAELTSGLERLHAAARTVPEIAEIVAQMLRLFRAGQAE